MEKTDDASDIVATEHLIKVPGPVLGQPISVVRRAFKEPPKLRDRHLLFVEKNALRWSLFALRFCVVTTSVSATILIPNFAFLARPGAHPDSFPNTDPFNTNAANYFLPMTALLGTAVSSAFIGSLSDKVGRRPCLLVNMAVTVGTTLAKYFARETFWGFCSCNFINGLFSSALPVAMAYASDVHPGRAQKDAEIGMLVGFTVMGVSGGGVFSIVMLNSGLFTPLLLAAGLNFLSLVILYLFLLEPDPSIHFEGEDTDGDDDAPLKMDKRLTANVILGAVLDNIGSTGLYPLSLAPLAFDTFYLDFVQNGEEPLLSSIGFRWLMMMLALMVVPGAALSQPVYARIGAAGGCVVGNAITAVGILGVLLIATRVDPPIKSTLAMFTLVLYSIFPMTVLSQLSTGPMMDMLAPIDRRGFAQGINSTIMNLFQAVSPYILGILADATGIEATLWTCIGVSVLAALVNLPLTFAPELKRKKEKNYQTAMEFEDQELVERLQNGEWVPASFLRDLNEARMKQGLPFFTPPIHSFEEDKNRLNEISANAKSDMAYARGEAYRYLHEMSQSSEKKAEIVAQMRRSAPSKEDQSKMAEDLGSWFADYMKDAGYFVDGGMPTLHKQILMKAFPPVNQDGELTEENIEPMILKYVRVADTFLGDQGPEGATKAFRDSVVLTK